MLAQISIDEKDLKGAFEKLKKSTQIKTSLYTDTEHPEVQKTVMQLQELASKIGFEHTTKPTHTMRPRHASASAALHNRNSNRGQTTENTSTMSDDGNPFSAILNMFGGGGQGAEQPDIDNSPPEENPFEKMLSREGTATFMGMTQEPKTGDVTGYSRPAGYLPTENLDLLRRFIRPDGKIITEEDSEDIDEAINKQMEKNDASVGSEDSEDKGKSVDEDSQEDKTAINDNPQLLEKLSKDQKAQLLKLKDDTFQKGALTKNYNPLPDVVNSKFFNSLSPKSRDQFRLLNMHIFEQK